ncbi:MAG: DUF6054 family protein [Clostridia bacterium]|nr:DUF6054 family protein [Clostridia bacterium]
MAKYEAVLHGNLTSIVNDVENAVTSSISATQEEASFTDFGTGKLVIRAYERYSYLGKNRVGLTVSYLATNDRVYVTAITTGGSQAMFFKINTIGEELFLEKIVPVLDKYKRVGY